MKLTFIERIATAIERWLHNHSAAHLFGDNESDRIARKLLAEHEREFTEMNEITAGLTLDLRLFQEAIGGAVWRTKTGHARGVAFLSDTHLKAIIDNNYGGVKVRQAVLDEQVRRAEDDQWARKQGPGSMRERVVTLEASAKCGWPTRRTLTRSEARRVARVLPDWARELIKELAA